MITDIIKQRLKTLQIDPSEAIIVGSSVLSALGIRDQSDIDIMIDEKTFRHIAAKGYPVLQYADGSGQMIVDDTELMYSWRGKTRADFLPNAIQIDGIWFMSLEDVRAWKLEQNRPKDQRDILLIENYMKAQTKNNA